MSTLPSELEPVANHVLFQFQEEIDRARMNAFKTKTQWGFELPSHIDDTTKSPRWVVIIGLGPEADDELHVGQTVLVDALMWTQEVEYKGLRFARTDSTKILAVDDNS